MNVRNGKRLLFPSMPASLTEKYHSHFIFTRLNLYYHINFFHCESSSCSFPLFTKEVNEFYSPLGVGGELVSSVVHDTFSSNRKMFLSWAT